jgi:hypothetical protein
LELIGKANLRTVGLFQERATSQAPFLHRHYPASTVLRACPPPHTAEPAPRGVLVESHDLSPLGLPVFRVDLLFQACRRHYPDGTAGCCRYLAQRHRPSPKLRRVGFRHSPFRGRAPPVGWSSVHSRFGLPVCSITQGDLYAEYFNAWSLPPCAALVASGRATDWPGGIRTHWRSPTFTAY